MMSYNLEIGLQIEQRIFSETKDTRRVRWGSGTEFSISEDVSRTCTCRRQQKVAQIIDAEQLSFQSADRFGWVDEIKHACKGYSAQGQVDVENLPPGHFVGKSAANYRTGARDNDV